MKTRAQNQSHRSQSPPFCDVPGCVFPVAAADALLWAQGRLHDKDLILHSPLVPEAVFFLDLPDLDSYRQCIEASRYWKERGAVCLIARTGTPVVKSHMLRLGAEPLWIEDTMPPKTRLFAPPASFNRWLAHK